MPILREHKMTKAQVMLEVESEGFKQSRVFDDLPWQRPDESVQEAFLAALTQRKITATLRREKGHDIEAACGQLRLKTERQLSNPPAAVNV